MPLRVHNGTSLVDYSSFKLFDGTSWVTPSAGKIYDGTTWKDFLVLIEFFGDSSGTQSNTFEVQAGYEFHTDGGAYTFNSTNGSVLSQTWCTPSAAATNYYVKATTTDQSGFISGGLAFDTWHKVTSNRGWYLSNTTNNTTKLRNVTFSIASDSAGTNVLASASVLISVTKGDAGVGGGGL